MREQQLNHLLKRLAQLLRQLKMTSKEGGK